MWTLPIGMTRDIGVGGGACHPGGWYIEDLDGKPPFLPARAGGGNGGSIGRSDFVVGHV